MNPAFGRYALVASALLAVGVNRAESQNARPEKVVLVVQAVEMSAKTLAQLGLQVNERGKLPLPGQSPFLKDLATWNVALDTAVKLDAARVIARTTLVTADGRKGEMEISGQAGDTSFMWSATPTLLGADKLRVEYHFRLSRTDSSRGVATPSGVKPAERIGEIFSGVEVPFDKPILLGRLGSFETATATAAKDSASGAKEQTGKTQEEQVTVVFLVARQLSSLEAARTPVAAENVKLADATAQLAKKQAERDKLRSEVERLHNASNPVRQVRLDLLVLEAAPDKLKRHLQSSQAPGDSLLAFLQKRKQEFSTAAVKPDNDKLLVQLIRPLTEAKVAKVLSNPKLITNGDRECWFQVGGEIPVPVPANDAITIEYKKYGTEFRCTPNEVSDRNVRLAIKAKHTFVDHASAKKIHTFTVPGLKTVEINSVHDVEFGELFVVGPLLSPDEQKGGRRETDSGRAIMIVATAHPASSLSQEAARAFDKPRPMEAEQRPVREAAGRPRRRAR